MAKCSRCGVEIGDAAACQACGAPPSQSVLDRGVRKTAHVTGKVIGTGVDVTETVVKETKPVFKKAFDLGKKGVVKAKDKTKEVAKDLQEK
ncbi:MAG: hypothetical protein AB1793_06260 [Candidatus Thermoplasmatota archaeon]